MATPPKTRRTRRAEPDMPAPTRAAPKKPAAKAERKPLPKAEAAKVEAEIHPDGKVWIDLLNPDEKDNRQAHLDCGKRIPSREDLSEVESSSRHYIENGALYLSAPLLHFDADRRPRLTPVGFILTPERLVTVRFEKLDAFDAALKAEQASGSKSAQEAFTRLIEAIVDTEADMLEHLGEELEDLGHTIFVESRDKTGKAANEMRSILRRLGYATEKLGKLRHSAATLGRIAAFVADNADPALADGLAVRIKAVREDLDSLGQFQEALISKGQFLLDAALGYINIDQNDVIKVLTVVSVVGVLPTLVASNYGMNFKVMPELGWPLGYPFALGLMVLTTVIPLAWFKWKKWF